MSTSHIRTGPPVQQYQPIPVSPPSVTAAGPKATAADAAAQGAPAGPRNTALNNPFRGQILDISA